MNIWGCGGSEGTDGLEPLTLAQLPGQVYVAQVEVDDSSVYVLNFIEASQRTEPPRATLYRTRISEPQETATILAEGTFSRFVLGPTHVYFIEHVRVDATPNAGYRELGRLFRVPRSGGSKELLAEGLELGYTAEPILAGPHLYWLGEAYQPTNSVWRTSTDAPSPIERVAEVPVHSAYNLMLSEAYFYWREKRTVSAAPLVVSNALVRLDIQAEGPQEDVLTWPDEEGLVTPYAPISMALTPIGPFAVFGEDDEPSRRLVHLPLAPHPAAQPAGIQELPPGAASLRFHAGSLYYVSTHAQGIHRRNQEEGRVSVLLPDLRGISQLAVSDLGLFFVNASRIQHLPHPD
ncbi:hypothetical protein SAMN04488504_105122 [Myxococcus virescens]|uniref:Lipoprotein n=1 Tax=Myxococcus virescens TaxID=83456 RepID=A0ABY0MQA1_9BACT|nr:hypothetical protein SAMN04488504_105122 [Myxococcus virescens]